MIITQMSKAATGVALLQVAAFAARWMWDQDLPVALLTAAFGAWALSVVAITFSWSMGMFGNRHPYYGVASAAIVAALFVSTIAAFVKPDVVVFLPWLTMGVTAAVYFVIIGDAQYRKGAKEPWWALALAISPLGIGMLFGIGHFIAYGNEKARTP